jgi:hypothetical protein
MIGWMNRISMMGGVVWALVLASGCSDHEDMTAEADSSEVGTADESIKGGSNTSGNRNVVKLWADQDLNDGFTDGAALTTCSGLIISRDTILTAGHCFRTNTPTAAHRWNNRNVLVGAAMMTGTSTGFRPLTLDGAGNWVVLTASVRIHPNFAGFRTPAGTWNNYTVPNDVATIQFSSPLPGITAADMPNLLMGETNGTTFNGTWYGYGPNGSEGTEDLRAAAWIGTASGGVLRSAGKKTAGCPGDSGGPIFASPSGVPRYLFGVFTAGNCQSSSDGAQLTGNAGFVRTPIANRCTTRTIAFPTPPPQHTVTISNCF